METEHLSAELTDQDRILLVLGYLGPLAFFSMVTSRREFVKWHSKQGLVLFALISALYVFFKLVFRFADRYLWAWIGDLIWATVWFTALAGLAVIVFCISRALEGERFKLPVLGDLADRL
jgi:uncharacterized membrane protein